MDVHERLVDLVRFPDWKTMLTDIVKTEGLDPWNVDISRLAGSYLEKINAMVTVDFHMPANAVLCSSILLRFKSDVWQLYPAEALDDKIEDESNWEYIIDGQRVPELDPTRRITRRRITIDDLISAVESVMEVERRRALRHERNIVVPTELMTMTFEDREDFEHLVEGIYGRILSKADEKRMALFSHIAGKTKPEFVTSLLAILYLETRGRIGLAQEQHFGDIFIFLADDAHEQETPGGSGALHELGAADDRASA